MTFEKAFVLKKLEELSEYMDEVRHLFQSPDVEILKDWGKIHIAERLLQLI